MPHSALLLQYFDEAGNGITPQDKIITESTLMFKFFSEQPIFALYHSINVFDPLLDSFWGNGQRGF